MEAKISVDYNPQMLPNVGDAIHRGVLLGVEKLATWGATKVQEKEPTATGHLVAATQSAFESGPNGMKATLFAGPPADTYVAPVETGSMPHLPPPEALLLWVMKRFHPESDKEALSIAWAVARTIQKRGTLGVGMFHRTFAQDIEPRAGEMIESSIGEELEKLKAGGGL